MDDQYKPATTITPLVRQYSLKAHEEKPEDTLSQALVSVIRKEDAAAASSEQQTISWKTWIEFGSRSDDATLNPLEYKRQEVVELWKRFSHLFANDRDPRRPLNSVPTISTLYEAIDQAQAAWHAKQSKGFCAAKGRFLNFAETMNEYSYLFSVIPSGDKYASLITGVVSSVVKVSVNYNKIAEGFSLALSDMSDSLRSVKKAAKIADTQDMRMLVVELYLEVFELLCHALTWFTSKRKRFSAALKRNFYDDTVKRLLTRMEKTVLAIDRESKHVTEGRLLELYQVVVGDGSHVVNRLRPVGNQNRRDDTGATQTKLVSMEEKLGFLSARTLNYVEQQETYNNLQTSARPVQEIKLLEQGSVEEHTGASELEIVPEDEADELCSRYDIEQYSSRLSEYLDDGRQNVSNALRGDRSSSFPGEVLLEMQKWIKTTESKMIWVQGISSMPYGTGLSRAAMRICDIAIETGIPCVSFFCKQRYNFAGAKDLTPKEAGLIAFLYSVVCQLACLLPTAFPVTEGLDEHHFSLLDGSVESIPATLELIRALLSHAPATLIWVIDGLQLAENETTIPHLQSFLEMLRSQEAKRTSKVCLTTDGNCFVLMRATNIRERVDASRTAQGRPGAILRGGSDVVELGDPAAKRF